MTAHRTLTAGWNSLNRPTICDSANMDQRQVLDLNDSVGIEVLLWKVIFETFPNLSQFLRIIPNFSESFRNFPNFS